MKSVEILKALADPTRLRLVHILANRGPDICVCDLVDVMGLPQGTISRHLMQLRHLGLVSDQRHGQYVLYSLQDQDSPLHQSIRKCLEQGCGLGEPVLLEDMRRFDQYAAESRLACCGPAASCCSPGNSPTAEKNNPSKRKPTK